MESLYSNTTPKTPSPIQTRIDQIRKIYTNTILPRYLPLKIKL